MNIIDYIAQDKPERAASFGEEIRAKTEQLKHHPLMFREGRKRGTRELVAHENYIIIYRVKAAAKTVEILNIKHAAQQRP